VIVHTRQSQSSVDETERATSKTRMDSCKTRCVGAASALLVRLVSQLASRLRFTDMSPALRRGSSSVYRLLFV